MRFNSICALIFTLMSSIFYFFIFLFQALDYVLVEARKHGIRLILSLANNLNAYGGKAQYVRWAKEDGINVSSSDSFFSDPIIKGYYRNYVKVCVSLWKNFQLTMVNTPFLK